MSTLTAPAHTLHPADRRSDRAAPLDLSWIERNPAQAFAALTVLYLATFFCLSYVKLLWLDELITLHIARLDSAKAIWQALSAGADPNPPLTHLAVMLCRRLFGERAWAFRLPAAIGYWIGMLAFFAFLKRRVPAVWALAATVIMMGMGGFDWSFESRSYAIFYGFTMAALYFWSRTGDDASATGRRMAIAAMAVCLALGLCANFFAVLAFLPVAAAEITRTFLQAQGQPSRVTPAAFVRHLRWPIWLAMAVAATPLLAFRSMIQTGIALYAPYAWNRASIFIAALTYTQIVGWLAYPLAGFMLLAFAAAIFQSIALRCRDDFSPQWLRAILDVPPASRCTELIPLPEAAAVAVLVAYPFLGYFLASLRGGMLSPRFVIPVCFGCAIAGILFAYRALGHLHSAGVAILTLALCWFVWRTAWSAYDYEVRKESFQRLIGSIPAPEYPGQPLAISDDLIVLPLEYYAPPAVTSRIVYPIDFPAILRDRGEASAEINFWSGRNTVYHFPIVPLATLQQKTSTYIILTSGREWLVDDLLRHFYQAEPLLIDAKSAPPEPAVAPLTHSRPVFFRAAGDRFPGQFSAPIYFDPAENMPDPAVARQISRKLEEESSGEPIFPRPHP